MKTVLSFGETLWDRLPTGEALGGAPCNFAYRVHEAGLHSRLVTRLGRDDLGRRALETMKELGLDTSLVQWDDERPTGTVDVAVGRDGSPEFTIHGHVAYDRIEATGPVLDAAAAADAVCFGSLAQRTPENRKTLARILEAASRAVRFLDLNLRSNCWTPETVRWCVDRASVLKLNEEEAFLLANQIGGPSDPKVPAGRAILDGWSLDACVVTLGADGALAYRGEEAVSVPGSRVKVVDTCGAGDAFGAAFLVSLLEGRSLEECCLAGNRLGAKVARTRGGTTPVREG